MFDKGYKLVANITGGGLGFFDELTKYGGASSLLLEGNIPYSQKSTIELLGGEPEKYVSEDTAIRLADVAYRRCLELSDKNPQSIGLGVTSQLRRATGERKGRQNFAWMALRHKETLITSKVELNFEKVRNIQESSLSNSAKWFLSYYIHGLLGCADYEVNIYHVPELYNNAELGVAPKFKSPINLLCGSFNPMHFGHNKVAKYAYDINGKNTYLEMSIQNVDKLPITSKSAVDRVKSIDNVRGGFIGGCLFTQTPKFVDKFDLFPKDTTYLMGADTWNRCMKDMNFRVMAGIMNTPSFILFARPGHSVNEQDIKGRGNVIYVDDLNENISSTEIRLTNSESCCKNG